ncbi:MAG: hypothetical protein IKE43_07910 [Coriobacteriales bacterium]|nr:hypothetical protein [Coriobacteriales bacterium]
MNSLCFCSAAFGSWGIVRLGTLVPECKMLFVCPYSCGRHNSIGAIQHGYKDRVSYLFIDEKDVALGTMYDDIPKTVHTLVSSEPKPKVVLIYFSCVLYMSGFDWDAIIEEISQEYPEIQFRACMMNPVASETSDPPVPAMIRTLCSLWNKDAGSAKTVNLLGPYSKLSPECELYTVLQACGAQDLLHFTNAQTYDDYALMGSSMLNLVIRPEGLLAAKAWSDTMNYCFLPVSYNLAEVSGQYETIFEALGAKTDLAPYYDAVTTAIEKARAMIGDLPIAVCSSATCRPFGLAKALVEYGFTVSDVFSDGCAFYDAEAKTWLAERGGVAFHEIHDPSLVEQVGHIGTAQIAIGFMAGYYSGAPHVVNLMLDEGHFGFYGIIHLMEMLRDAAATQSSLEACIERYGLII